ncbi:MAG: MarR family transcriptional regulator [Bacteroidia bacterium]
MQLEKAIKQQKPFAHPKHKLVVNIIYSQSWLRLKVDTVFKTTDVTSQQYNILRILRGQHPNPATVNLLVERMIDKMSNASRLVDRLYNKGYVERIKNKTDRRAVDVSITERGLSFLQEMDARLAVVMENMFDLNDGETEQLNELLDKMRGDEKV